MSDRSPPAEADLHLAIHDNDRDYLVRTRKAQPLLFRLGVVLDAYLLIGDASLFKVALGLCAKTAIRFRVDDHLLCITGAYAPLVETIKPFDNKLDVPHALIFPQAQLLKSLVLPGLGEVETHELTAGDVAEILFKAPPQLIGILPGPVPSLLCPLLIR